MSQALCGPRGGGSSRVFILRASEGDFDGPAEKFQNFDIEYWPARPMGRRWRTFLGGRTLAISKNGSSWTLLLRGDRAFDFKRTWRAIRATDKNAMV
jgi:hypothetical protein